MKKALMLNLGIGQHSHQWAPFQVAGLLHAWLISHQISRYVYHEGWSTLCNPSVSCFHDILGLPGPRFPSTCMSKAVLIAPLEHSTCPYQWSLLSFRMRSRSSMPSSASSSLDLVVAMSWGITLQICLIIALSFRCRCWKFSFVSAMEHCPPHTRAVHMATSWKKGGGKTELLSAPWIFSRQFSHMLWLKVHSHRLLRAYLLGSKRKLPPPACQIWLWLPSVVCRPRGVQFPDTVYICTVDFLLVRTGKK